MNANKSRNVSVLRTSSSKNGKIIPTASMKTLDMSKRHPSIKESESKDMLITNQILKLKKENVALKNLLNESEKIMKSATTKSLRDSASLRHIIEGIWPVIEVNITNELKHKIRQTLQIMEDTMSKPNYENECVQCSEEEDAVSIKDKFQSELTKYKLQAENQSQKLQKTEEKIVEYEKTIAEATHEINVYKRFSQARNTDCIPSFLRSLKSL